MQVYIDLENLLKEKNISKDVYKRQDVGTSKCKLQADVVFQTFL